MSFVRKPAVAGLFYPRNAQGLRAAIECFLARASPKGPPPKAVIAPHAGFEYSGPIAASAYARVRPAHATITRVVLLGPSHRVPFQGLAASGAAAFETPLGLVPLDAGGVAAALAFPSVQVLDAAHAPEHSLEVHLPFLQVVLDRFTLVPLLVGGSTPEEVGVVLQALWGGPETLIVVSSDLSHYHEYAEAQRIDAETAGRIERGELERLTGQRACGFLPVGGLLNNARRDRLSIEAVDLRNSGDTAGDRSRVVGYGAFTIG
jgi:AmmeMemoRadiSam system protein B